MQFSLFELPKLIDLRLRVTTPNRESLLGLTCIMKACPFLQKLILQVNGLIYYSLSWEAWDNWLIEMVVRVAVACSSLKYLSPLLSLLSIWGIDKATNLSLYFALQNLHVWCGDDNSHDIIQLLFKISLWSNMVLEDHICWRLMLFKDIPIPFRSLAISHNSLSTILH